MELIEQFRALNSLNKLLTTVSGKKGNIFKTSPLSGSARILFADYATSKIDKVVLLFDTIKGVNEAEIELRLLDEDLKVITITDFQPNSIQEKLTQLSRVKKGILLATYEILELQLPSQEQIEQKLYRIEKDTQVAFNELIDKLEEYKYQRDKYVLHTGEYSVRGAIVDFWSFSEKMPIRIEFDGDLIETIRTFDPESQRSIERLQSITIAKPLSNSDDSSNIYGYIENSLLIVNRSEYANYIHEKDKPKTRREVAKPTKKRKSKDDYDDDFPEVEQAEIGINEQVEKTVAQTIDERLFYNPGVNVILEQDISEEIEYQLNFKSSPTIKANYSRLFEQLRELTNKNYQIYIAAENEIQTGRLSDLLSDINSETKELILSGKVKTVTLPIKEGFVSVESKTAVFSDYEIFGKPYRTKLPNKQAVKKNKRSEVGTLKIGDVVVHEEFGVGRYDGLVNIKIGDSTQESMKLTYAEGGTVYVNLSYLHLVSKFSHSETENIPQLASLGSPAWQKAKAKTKKKIREVAKDLIELYAKRKSSKGYSFGHDTIWQKELEASFIYEDTPDQIRVIREVKEDMEAPTPMDRLVCGDVGFGKTEVAVRAAFKCVQDNKQTAVLVPTTILAEQHYNTFCDRMSQFPIRIEALSRFQSKAEQKKILADLKAGKVDIIIGTHRLLSKDVEFSNFGLLIIDEEQRFGVTAKEKLRKFRENIDTLTLTATPIPRTLNFSLLGARDLSIIATPPPNRISIMTKVAEFDILKIREWILNEIDRNGQIYFVHDRINSIEKLANYIKRYIPSVRTAVAHGQMKPDDLESIIHDFQNRKYDVLLSTKIIESGIDIPNANTMIVNRADRFGLAELHQLRGRVGRSDRQAFAYFLIPDVESLKRHTTQKLKAIEEYSDLGGGFNLAMRDLEIRGAGNLLGTEQTGFITEIGFDLFLKLVDETVEELKRTEYAELFKDVKTPPKKSNPTIETYFEIGIPKTFMPDQADRLSFYTSMLNINKLYDLQEITDELRDRFGSLPNVIERLIKVAILKFYASQAQFEKIKIMRNSITIGMPPETHEEFYTQNFEKFMRYILEYHKNRIQFNQTKGAMSLSITNNFLDDDHLLDYLIELSKSVAKLVYPNFNAEVEKEIV